MQAPATVLALLLALAWASGHAQDNADAMARPACLAARQQLDAALAAGGPRERLNAARSQAALRCLGRTTPRAPPGRFDPSTSSGQAEPRTGRFVPPPVAVTPVPVPPGPVLPPVSALPPSPLPIPRPAVITTCDAAGCWDSSGARHNHQGPVLVGPRGLCTLQGGLLNCP